MEATGKNGSGRVLVTWGTEHGGTEGIARMIADVLVHDGFEVLVVPATLTHDVRTFDAVVVGGALYANRWHHDARRFVAHNAAALRRIPVWMFSCGPLDDSADRLEIPAVRQVQKLMERIGARGHATFGGRLLPDAEGFVAHQVAKTHAGDWRNPARISAWAHDIARRLHAEPAPRSALDGAETAHGSAAQPAPSFHSEW